MFAQEIYCFTNSTDKIRKSLFLIYAQFQNQATVHRVLTIEQFKEMNKRTPVPILPSLRVVMEQFKEFENKIVY